MRDFFLENKNSIKIAINFHAWGNLFINPFNYDNSLNNELEKKFKKQAEIYNEIFNETGLP